MLTPEEKLRYSRHLLLPEVGASGQIKLKRAQVLVVGAGGLGCPALQYLAAAGVGVIGIMDDDVVETSNLQRQVLYDHSMVGQKKALAAAARLRKLNPLVTAWAYAEKLTAANAIELISSYDLVIDGTDNFTARYLINDACVRLNKPWIYGSVHRFEGQVAVFNYQGGPTYRCLFPVPPAGEQAPNCAEAGVLGVLPGLIGAQQAAEALKIILGIGQPLSGCLWTYDVLRQQAYTIEVKREAGAIAEVKKGPLTEIAATCAAEDDVKEMTAEEFMRAPRGVQLLDVREAHETPRLEELLDNNLQPGTVINCPLNELENNLPPLNPALPVAVVCQKGVRSQKAARLLSQKGLHPHIYSLQGGVNALRQFILKSKTYV